jgi:hypothetical protein
MGFDPYWSVLGKVLKRAEIPFTQLYRESNIKD